LTVPSGGSSTAPRRIASETIRRVQNVQHRPAAARLTRLQQRVRIFY